jgi:hypothetical protein
VFRSGSPKQAAGPETENRAPILTGGAAAADPTIKKAITKTKKIFKIFLNIDTSLIKI